MCHNFHSIQLIYVVADSVDVSIEIFTFLALRVDSPWDCDGIDGHGETLSRLVRQPYLLAQLCSRDQSAHGQQNTVSKYDLRMEVKLVQTGNKT